MSAAAIALRRWRGLSGRARVASVIAAVVVAYFVALLTTGPHGYVHQKSPIGIILLGLVYGSVNALGAMGLILVYRANRFINFAHGAMGSIIGVLAIGLVKVHGLNYWIALPVAVIAGGALGALIEVSTIRRFANAPRLILLVASIGLAQVLGGLELLGSKQEGFTSLTGAFTPPFSVAVHVDVYTFHSAEILAVAVVPAVLAFLGWFLLRTDAGIAIRAAAENSDRALLLGVPVRRLATIVWTLAGALAVLTYMLSAPFEGVKPGVASNGPTVLVPMLAVAIVARMESMPTAFGAGIALGIMDSLVRWNTTGSPALVWPIYLGVIIVALLAQSGKLSRAQESGTSSWSAVSVLKPIPDELKKLPEVIWFRRALLAAVIAAFIVIPHTWGSSNQLLAGFAIVWAMVGVSLVVLTGWGGQISLGQFGIAGVAGVVGGNMVAHWNADFFFVILAAGAVGALVALLVGLPALRIKGLFLAVTTLAVAVALDQYFLNQSTLPQLIPLQGVRRPLLLQRFNLDNNYELYLTCLAFLALTILATMGMRKARAGRVLIGVRDNERAAASVSVPTTNVKLAGFAVAGVIAGVAGALDVYLLQALNPGSFAPVDSMTVFGYSVIGGLGSVTGVLLGVLIFKYLESITAFGQFHLAVSGAALLWVLQVIPGGFGQVVYDVRDRLLRVVASRRGILVPSLVADKRAADGGGRQDDLLTAIASGQAATSNGHGNGNGSAHSVKAAETAPLEVKS
ncbi:MAG TPA: ABC transporter permease [Acidimicrobiales bacterium]|nr:ABC transporter permease [Acidimicrobiales bacterium]